MNTAGVIILVIILLLVGGAAGWIIYTRVRASQLGLPPPPLRSYIPFTKSSVPVYGGVQPAPGGVIGWINDRVRDFKNRNNRTAAGAYEGAAGGSTSRGRRGFGPLDPDEAWDSRVGAEADAYGYYGEEQELGLHSDTGYSGAASRTGGGSRLEADSYPMNLAATPGASVHGGYGGGGDDLERGRVRSRSPGEQGGGGVLAMGRRNPFEDDAEPSNISMRGVSPRPIDTSVGDKGGKKDEGDSPTERRSVFRENM